MSLTMNFSDGLTAKATPSNRNRNWPDGTEMLHIHYGIFPSESSNVQDDTFLFISYFDGRSICSGDPSTGGWR